MLKICITGHRTLAQPGKLRREIADALLYFSGTDQQLTALSAAAAGADTLFAEEALQQHIPLEIVVPFDIESYKKDFHGDDTAKLENILRQVTFETPYPVVPADPAERNKYYWLTGKLLVDRADIVLAVWDGKPANGKGGTADVIAYAKEQGKELHIIHAARPARENETADTDEHRACFEEMDRRAKFYKNHRFEPAWITGIILGILAVACFAVPLAFFKAGEDRFWFSFAELLCLLLSFFSLAILAKRWKKKFLAKRRGAEYFRAVLWYKNAGIPVPPLETPNFEPGEEVAKLEKEIAAAQPPLENLANAKRLVWDLAYRQINYHKRRIEKFKRKHRRLERGFFFIKALFLTAAVTALAFEAYIHFSGANADVLEIKFGALLRVLLFIELVLPAVYAALEGIKYFGEWKRNIAVSGKTTRFLEKIKRDLVSCTNETTFAAHAKALREILELENSDWAEMVFDKEESFAI